MDRPQGNGDDDRWEFLGGSLWNLILNIVAGIFTAALFVRAKWLENPTNNTLTLLGAAFVIVAMVVATSLRARRQRGLSVVEPPNGPERPSDYASTTDAAAPPAAATGLPTPSPIRAFVREKNAAEILSILKETLPLQRKAVWEGQYKGRWARWSGTVSIISDDRADFGCVTVHVDQEKGTFTIDIPAADVSSVEPIRVDDVVAVEGQINTYYLDSFVSLRPGRIVEHTATDVQASGSGRSS